MLSEGMKKVLLVNTNTEKFPYPIPPVGLCLLASSLAGHYQVKLVDMMFQKPGLLLDTVSSFAPDYIGFSIRNVDDVVAGKTVFYPKNIRDAMIRPVQDATDVPIILGGSGFSVFPREMMDYFKADFGIIGEGEGLFLKLLHSLDSGIPLEDDPRILVRKNPLGSSGIRHRDIRKMQDFIPLHTVPLSNIDHYLSFDPYRERGVYSIQTKRGCHFGCVYCTYPFLEGKKYRLRDPWDIACEIEEVSDRLGPVMFEFVDSVFNAPKGHAEAICRAIIKKKIHPRMRTMGINPNNTSRTLFSLMKEAGFVQIDVTPDSASPTVIHNLKKGFSMEDIHRTATIIRELDIPTMWFFLFGGPGETPETVQETFRFIRENIPPHDMVLMLAGLRIYPNTPLEIIARDEGLIEPTSSLFYPSLYYYSKETPSSFLHSQLEFMRDVTTNCLPATESTPPKEMIAEAIAMRKAHALTEPMFRTLLKIREKRKGIPKK